jgi:uncharacterized protein YigA (DUF484 family)
VNNQAQQKQHMSDDEQQLISLLKDNPDILNRYPALLAELEVPHAAAAGAAVSLIERQVRVLRDRITAGELRMREFMDIARDNERLAMSRHRLALNLLGAQDFDDVISLILAELGDELGADHVVVRLFTDRAEDVADRADVFVPRDHEDLNRFRTMMKNRLPVCGRSSDDQNAFLFAEHAPAIASAAVIPLVAGADLGLLGLGSEDASRFSTSMGTHFLQQTGELVSTALARHLELPR